MTSPLLERITGDSAHAATSSARLPLAALAARSASEMVHYLHGRESDDAFARELFHRAIVDGDGRAWEAVYAQYWGLVLSWLRRHPAYVPSGDDHARANAAFAQFWGHIPPARFDDFPTVAALLRYLKLCVHTVLLNEARAREREQLTEDIEAEAERAAIGDVADATVDSLTAGELWAVVVAITSGEEERVIAEDALLLGMKAAEIQVRHPALFADVGQVYRVKRNLTERLQRSAAIRALR